jgi:hypothetical protein
MALLHNQALGQLAVGVKNVDKSRDLPEENRIWKVRAVMASSPVAGGNCPLSRLATGRSSTTRRIVRRRILIGFDLVVAGNHTRLIGSSGAEDTRG